MTEKKETQEREAETKKPERIQWFHINREYLSVCRYALLVIFVAIIIYSIASHAMAVKQFFSNLFAVLAPFFIGILLAYFLSPLVKRIEDLFYRRIPKGKAVRRIRAVSILIVYLIALGFVALVIAFVLPQVGQSIQELTDKIPTIYQQIMQGLETLQKRYPKIDFEFLREQLAAVMPDVVSYVTNLMGNLIPMVYSLSVFIGKAAINIIFGIMISIYMIYSEESFHYQGKRVVYAIFSEEKGDALCSILRECNRIFASFLISKMIDSLIIGCICCVVMNIIGLPYSVLLSVIVGITNMIPYFGPFIGAVPGIFILLCSNWRYALIFAVMILAIQQFDGLILGPRILGQSTGLSPIWVIFAITVGGAYFGVLGMFIGVPVVAVIAYLLDRLIAGRLSDKTIRALQQPNAPPEPKTEAEAEAETEAEE